jgi:hypothetical protein
LQKEALLMRAGAVQNVATLLEANLWSVVQEASFSAK